MTRTDIRNLTAPGSDPKEVPLRDSDTWKAYEAITGHIQVRDPNVASSIDRIPYAMSNLNARVSINTSNSFTDVGHKVVMDNIVIKTVYKCNGTKTYKFIYKVMDPAFGGLRRIYLGQIKNALNIFVSYKMFFS
ncbi:MAG: hypothetical protein JXK95_10645 [Bacteroidales bacterium]|nr:hypothetical protein [Bacteroidales bacterium]